MLYHLNKDVPDIDTTGIYDVVNKIYNIESKTCFRTIEVPMSERRIEARERHQKILDNIARISS